MNRARGPVWITRLWNVRTGIVLAWSATFGAIAYGLHALEPHARTVATQAPVELRWVHLPPWLADPDQRELLEEITQSTRLRPETRLHTPELCLRIAENLRASPWIAELRRVSKRSDGVVRVDASFRKPLTWAVKDGVAYLVDETGVRLPRHKQAAFVDHRAWIVVLGMKGDLPQKAGQKWPGQDLAAGLKLVKFLYRAEVGGALPFRAALRAVDVSLYNEQSDPRGGRLRIVTISPDKYIDWGLAPGEEYELEAPAEQKLAVLSKLYQREGRLPDVPWIDVRAEEWVDLGQR